MEDKDKGNGFDNDKEGKEAELFDEARRVDKLLAWGRRERPFDLDPLKDLTAGQLKALRASFIFAREEVVVKVADEGKSGDGALSTMAKVKKKRVTKKAVKGGKWDAPPSRVRAAVALAWRRRERQALAEEALGDWGLGFVRRVLAMLSVQEAAVTSSEQAASGTFDMSSRMTDHQSNVVRAVGRVLFGHGPADASRDAPRRGLRGGAGSSPTPPRMRASSWRPAWRRTPTGPPFRRRARRRRRRLPRPPAAPLHHFLFLFLFLLRIRIRIRIRIRRHHHRRRRRIRRRPDGVAAAVARRTLLLLLRWAPCRRATCGGACAFSGASAASPAPSSSTTRPWSRRGKRRLPAAAVADRCRRWCGTGRCCGRCSPRR